MTARNFVMTADDEARLTPETLRRHASYEGDHEFALTMRAMARKLLLLSNPSMSPAAMFNFLESSVKGMPVSIRTANVIAATGYVTVRQVFEGGWAYLLRQRNFGERSRLELVDLFTRYGLIWQEGVCDAPKSSEGETQLSCPLMLFEALLGAAKAHFAEFVKEHGRYATRGHNMAEYSRREILCIKAQILLNEVTDNDSE